MRSHLFVTGIAIGLSCMSSPVKSEIVFDNITAATQPGGGIVTDPGYQGGSTINLAGASREVVHLDVLLYEFGGVTGDLTFQLNLWAPSATPNVPGTLLWTSSVQHALLLNRTPTIFGIDVPVVHVPDALGWTVEGLTSAHSAGIAGSTPATVGTITGQMIFNTHVWSVVRFAPRTDGVGFRVIAVPEPTTRVLAILAAAVLFYRRSR